MFEFHDGGRFRFVGEFENTVVVFVRVGRERRVVLKFDAFEREIFGVVAEEGKPAVAAEVQTAAGTGAGTAENNVAAVERNVRTAQIDVVEEGKPAVAAEMQEVVVGSAGERVGVVAFETEDGSGIVVGFRGVVDEKEIVVFNVGFGRERGRFRRDFGFRSLVDEKKVVVFSVERETEIGVGRGRLFFKGQRRFRRVVEFQRVFFDVERETEIGVVFRLRFRDDLEIGVFRRVGGVVENEIGFRSDVCFNFERFGGRVDHRVEGRGIGEHRREFFFVGVV